MAAKPAAEPQSLDDLFLDAKPAAKKDPASLDDLFVKNVPPESEAEREPTSLDDLFLDREVAQPVPGTTQPAAPTQTVEGIGSAGAQKDDGQTRISGFFQNRLAYTYAKPRHWSKFENTLDVAATGRNGGVSWKLGGQLNYDPIYDLTDFYPSSVRDDQRLWGDIREAYLDFSVDAWEFRLGRQHIIWGEMVGLFFADVVSAKDLREAGLREFDMTRLPQWAARAEYFKGDFHGELVWIPHMTYNEIGKPGAEFYPFMPPPGITANILSEDQPKGLDDSAYGTRLSYLKDGWDMALFFYSSNDSSPAFERVSQVGSVVTFRPIHKRIQQWGLTT
ncbi:MAG: hypothetical protein MUC79_10370, partial [Thiobacillaceae bacterium]|nr:hypothetical protein [Thiobacillaceae bacterium]